MKFVIRINELYKFDFFVNIYMFVNYNYLYQSIKT